MPFSSMHWYPLTPTTAANTAMDAMDRTASDPIAPMEEAEKGVTARAMPPMRRCLAKGDIGVEERRYASMMGVRRPVCVHGSACVGGWVV